MNNDFVWTWQISGKKNLRFSLKQYTQDEIIFEGGFFFS